ncbi:MAG TPA: hypothetical protein VK483_02125 [Chitinophagaceae bacterium]|nr:hypothetical protein [Chitinophagaceae bacterium]
MNDLAEPVRNNDSRDHQPKLEKCINFLNEIGINTIWKTLGPGTFLPGLSIEKGCIIIDRDALSYPGDILHEAGHIAVVPAAERSILNADSIKMRTTREAEEMMAIAWSYAACIHLDLDPCFVFHDEGYQGGGSHIAENFNNKRFLGLPMLQWIGLAADKKNASIMNVSPYPSMIKWLRD